LWKLAGGARRQRRNGPEAMKLAATGANRGARWWSGKAERARKSEGAIAKWQAGNIDPGMAALRGVVVAGERKADTSKRLREEEQAAVSQEALIRESEKPMIGEQRGESPGASERDAQYGACPW